MKILKLAEYTNEKMFVTDENNNVVELEYELFKDNHPMKYNSLGKNIFTDDEFVWVIRKDKTVFSIFSCKIDENIIRDIFKKLNNYEK